MKDRLKATSSIPFLKYSLDRFFGYLDCKKIQTMFSRSEENCFYCIVPSGHALWLLPGMVRNTSKAHIIVFAAGILLRTLCLTLVNAPTKAIPVRA